MPRSRLTSSSPLFVALVVAGWHAPALAQEQPPAAPEITAVARAPRVAGIEVHGSIDPPGHLERYLAQLVPTGTLFIEAGPSDKFGAALSTPERLARALERLGYHPEIATRPGPDGASVSLVVRLRAYDRIRQIFVRGNWPLRQDEIVRRLSLRPGQPIPIPGPDRDARTERERAIVEAFLRDQGYLDARVRLELRTTKAVPSPVDVIVRIELGPGYPVGSVAVQGNTALSTEEIAAQFRHLDWRFLWSRPLPFKLSLLRQDLATVTERYHDLGLPGVRVRSDYDPATSVDRVEKVVRLGITVTERKRVEVAFEGNRRFDAADLAEVTRGAYDGFDAEARADAIAQLYRGKGHMFVKVTWRIESLSPQVQRLVFVIAEGPSLKVRGVTFAGNAAFAASRLGDVVTVREFPLLGFVGLGEGGYASFRQLELDVERLQFFYAEAGYPDAKVSCEVAPGSGRFQHPASVRPDDPAWQQARALQVRFLVDEGPRVDIGELRFEGGPLPYDEPFLREALDAKVGEPYRPALVRGDVARLKRLLGDAGYPQGTAEPLVTRVGNRQSIVWQVQLGPKLRVGPLFVRGNFLTSPGTIERWTLLREGDALTTTAFERSQRNLALIQLFNNPSPINFPPESQTDEIVPMLVEVEERHPQWGIVRVGGGASTQQAPPNADIPLGVYAAVGYEHRNLFGQGWTILSRAELGNSLTRVQADFLDARFFGTQFRLELSGSYLRQSTVRLGDIRSGGGAIGFARQMYPGVDAAVRYSLRNTFRTEFFIRDAGPDEGQETVRLGTAVGSLSFTVEWQRLDNLLVPTRGFKLQGGVELATPALSFGSGEDAFLKTNARSLVVVPLGTRMTLRHSVRYDQGFPLGGASFLPKVERFFAGGDTTLRGFDLDRARVQITRSQLGSYLEPLEYRPLGGNLRVLHNVDFQIRLAGAWYGALFFDSGVVADSFVGLTLREFRHGVGVTPFLFKLPVGDLSMSWAWPLDAQPGDSRIGRLHFNVGLMF